MVLRIIRGFWYKNLATIDQAEKIVAKYYNLLNSTVEIRFKFSCHLILPVKR